MFKKTAFASAIAAVALVPLSQAQAADYQIDTEGQHAFVQFKISHLASPTFSAALKSSMVSLPMILKISTRLLLKSKCRLIA